MTFTGSNGFSGKPGERASLALRLTPEILLQAYAAGIFPMAETADDTELFWVDPPRRGILPLDAFHVPRRLARLVRQDRFTMRCDTAFEAGVGGRAPNNQETPDNP